MEIGVIIINKSRNKEDNNVARIRKRLTSGVDGETPMTNFTSSNGTHLLCSSTGQSELFNIRSEVKDVKFVFC